jgi:hypothetical protein
MRLIRASILVFCLLLIAIVAVAALHSNSENAGLSSEVASALRSRDAPPAYQRCVSRQLQRRLTDRESRLANTDLPPATRRKLRASGVACARRLVRSGSLSADDVIRMRERLQLSSF